jgi:antitoxin (DNA-binding transcriptional repressor) of toxin-antitoxin stability system
MKAINVTELKTNLSRYLRIASRGTRIVINDRDEPIAQIGPPEGEARSWHERLAREGRLRLGSQDWGRLSITPHAASVDIQAVLSAVREEPDEVRRR